MEQRLWNLHLKLYPTIEERVLDVRKTICFGVIFAMIFSMSVVGVVSEDNIEQTSLTDIAFSDSTSLGAAAQMMIRKLDSDGGMRTLNAEKMNEFLTQFAKQFSIAETEDNVLSFDGFDRNDTYEINFWARVS